MYIFQFYVTTNTALGVYIYMGRVDIFKGKIKYLSYRYSAVYYTCDKILPPRTVGSFRPSRSGARLLSIHHKCCGVIHSGNIMMHNPFPLKVYLSLSCLIKTNKYLFPPKQFSNYKNTFISSQKKVLVCKFEYYTVKRA